ncbi:MAG: M14-type cytosolic carboxypeptidase [Hyphomonadaceae bacterium]|nr:M14-type cytosolic carboxypeptidase [Hyphomonadaceae bacterium]
MSLQISSAFDGGNIIVKDLSDPSNVRLEIARDHQSEFYQWFYFRVTGPVGEKLCLVIENAGDAAYPKGWENYQAVVSHDLEHWRRVPTRYDGKTLSIDAETGAGSVYVAYFAPYPTGRHRKLIAQAGALNDASVSVLGQTLDGRDMDLITIGAPSDGKRALWITARQHPGETMAEWWMEGFLERLGDEDDEAVSALREQATLYLVPNMCPDGSARGHLRTNAAGVNLNREWASPSLEKSPEVFLVLEKMKETGLDLALDVHGDEALPYNFIAGTEGIPDWTNRLADLQQCFLDSYVASSSGEFQTKFGYPKNKPGKANLTICSNALAQHFDALAMTLEMPFKDNADLPNAEFGWSPERAKQLGRDAVEPILAVLPALR